MHFSLGLPTDRIDQPDEFVTGAAIAQMAAAADAAGFGGVFVTDHPAPDQQWLVTGGHHALDPLVALAFASGAAPGLKLQTHIYVLPYRNPFLAAKGVLSLQQLSGGQVIFGVAAGYLRSEFNTLGVDFDERNDLLDEAIDVCRAAWTQDVVAYEGRHFRSRGTTMAPRPAVVPPVWIGGNSRRAMRRAAVRGDGWVPFPNPRSTAKALKTPPLETVDDLAARIAELRSMAQEAGRSAPLDVCFAPFAFNQFGTGAYDRAALLDEIAAMAEAGVTWLTVGFHRAADRSEWCDWAARFGEEIVAPATEL